MIKFLDNIGDFFATNYFDEDFVKKVHAKSGYSNEDQKKLQKRISPLRDKYFKYKQSIIEGRLRIKDKVYETHKFHTQLLNALGYDGDNHQYNEPFHFSETEVLPVRHKLYRGDQLHVMIMEMQPLIKEGDEEPDGLFEQRYNIEDDQIQSKEQRYHRVQWGRVFKVDESLKISPVIINKAISQLCLLDQKERPQYILLLAGNVVFLIDVEKWFRGSYLYFDLEEFFSEATITRNYYSLFYLLLSKDMLSPDSDMVLMDQLEEDSHKSAYEVTKDLKEGIIHAVEALANEAIYYQKEILKQEFDETDDDYEAQVKDDCLSIVYRLLFIFYAESRPDLDILPISDSVYQKGYSLEMLRDLEQTPLVTDHSANGYFFHDSLYQLFQLMSSGYRENENGGNKSFRIRHIDSPLFDDGKLNQLKGIKYRNVVWQEVICQLSLSREVRGKNRGRISYANLGINQIGSVYESLLAFRGFYAEQDYIEVHPKNKPKEGTLLVTRNRIEDFDDAEILKDEHGKNVIIPKGKFVYRLSGRDRQKSASYYTPEVLTQCTVKYTLKSILEKVESGEMKALELLELKLLEPAMGAAAFHNELINQLAEAYLSYRQKELKQKVSPELFQEELQKVKAYIATNNTYGVDLNPTAIELGKLSLWLNVIHKDMETPFFGYRLGVGNAVVGAWLKVYKKKDFIKDLTKPGTTAKLKKSIKKKWWDKAPKHIYFKPYESIQRKKDEIYHFLLPDKNMVPSAGIKLLKNEFDTEATHVRDWKKDFCKPIDGEEFKRLQKISKAVDLLLEEHYKFQASINAQTKTKGDFFGAYEAEEQHKLGLRSYDEKEQLAAQRNNTNAPYYKLKLIMDYWCALWFWDMREAAELPTRQQWYDDLEKIINIDLRQIEVEYEEIEGNPVATPTLKQTSLFEAAEPQHALKSYRKDKTLTLKKLGEALQANPDSLFKNKRSEIVNKLADQYKFFHNELEFIEVFKERGGFDVIVGNPPWDQVEFDEVGFVSEKNPIYAIRKFKELKFEITEAYRDEILFAESCKAYFRSKVNYPLNTSSKSNLYKLFFENSFDLGKNVGLIHDRGIYSDSKGIALRNKAYAHLKYLFRFNNELKLFAEVGNAKKYEISIINNEITGNVKSFIAISNLFHATTIDQSFTYNSAEIYNIRDEHNNWELRGNKDRLIRINQEELDFLGDYFDDNQSKEAPILPYIHSSKLYLALKKIMEYTPKLKDLRNSIVGTQMLNENEGQKDGIIIKEPGLYDLDEFVLNGPNIYPGNPLFQTPNKSAKNHRDYSSINLEFINKDFIPFSIYRLINRDMVNCPNDYFHVHRRRAINTNERTLISAIMPPNIVHTRSCYSLSFDSLDDMLIFSSSSISIIFDYAMRATGKEDFVFKVVNQLPILTKFKDDIIVRGTILNSITSYYSDLWHYVFNKFINYSEISNISRGCTGIKKLSTNWEFNDNLRTSKFRKLLEIELDVLVSMSLGLTLDSLIDIYLGDFSVLKQNENDTWYDTKGNIVFTCSKGLTGVGVDRPVWRDIKDLKAGETYEHTIEKSELYKGKKVTYHAPFDKCDRVEDYKVAWAHFEEVFKDED